MSEPISEVPPPLAPRRRVRGEKPRARRALRIPAASPPSHLVFPEEKPFEECVTETKRHFEARTMLYLVLKKAYEMAAKRHREGKRRQVAIGCDQFVYYDATDPKKCFSPDVFVKVNSNVRDFPTWKVWELGTPDLVVEVMSDHDRSSDVWRRKLERYKAGGVREVVRFDATSEDPIAVWDRVGDLFVERKRVGSALFECKTLGLYWLAIPDPTYGPLLRLAKDRAGKQVLPTPLESELHLEQELAEERRLRAEVDHARLLEEEARERADEQRRVAEQKHREERAAREQLQAELARVRAELEQLRKSPR